MLQDQQLEAKRAAARRDALGRNLNVTAKRHGQLTLQETPDYMTFNGCEFPTIDVDLFISGDLKHRPYLNGAEVFCFRSGRKHIFAATVIDSVSIDRDYDEILAQDWHVELFHRKADAAARIARRADHFAKKSGGLAIRNDGESA